MVQVEAPSSTGSGQPSASDPSKLTTSQPVISSSFDNLDELLDETPAGSNGAVTRAEPSVGDPSKSTSSEPRWKTEPNTKPAENETFAEANIVASIDDQHHSAETSSDPPAEVPNVAAEKNGWASYVILVGGGILGLSVAAGLAAFILLRTGSGTPEVSSVPPPKTEEAIDNSAEASVPPPIVEPVADQPIQQDEDPVDEPTQQPDDGHDEPSSEVVANAVQPAPSSSASTAEETNVPSPAPVEATAPNEAENNSQIDLADDGLASFARWLQEPDSMNPAAPAEPATPVVAAPETPAATKTVRQTRPIPAKVDIEARLSDPIIAIEFKETSLSDALRSISSYSTIPITLDPDALGRRNLSARQPVNLLVRSKSTVAEVLARLLKPLRLGYFVLDGQLIITTVAASQGELVQFTHPVGDLCDNDPAQVQAFSDWITKFVQYGSWKSQGGEGQSHVDGMALVIDQDDTVQYQVLMLCERLRIARGDDVRSGIKPEFVNITQKGESLTASDRPVTLRIWRDSSLDSIASELEAQADVQVLIDWHALYMAGWSPKDRMKFFCQDLPLTETLEALLRPMGLTYRILDSATIQITSPEIMADYLDVEFYRVPNGVSYEELSQKIVRQIGPARFQPTGRGAITYDTKSKSLVVSLSQADQAVVRTLIP